MPIPYFLDEGLGFTKNIHLLIVNRYNKNKLRFLSSPDNNDYKMEMSKKIIIQVNLISVYHSNCFENDFDGLKVLVANFILKREKIRKEFLRKDADISVSSLTIIDKQTIERAIAIIEDNLSNSDFTVKHLCSEIGQSRPVLFRKLKALIDQSPQSLIRMVRLNKGKEFLNSGKYSVLEVCYMVGFSSPGYFSRAYKKHFGVSPKETKI